MRKGTNKKIIPNFFHLFLLKIFEGIEYELDNQGRATFINILDGRHTPDKVYREEFIEYTDGKKYMKNTEYITYTDSSWTSFGYFDLDYYMPGAQSRWATSTYVFYENGNEKRQID